jgi:ATP/maltotriose-dependent transcriptional regulator MalT
MELEQLTVPTRRKKHRFIERPRLLRSLDTSKARVRMLIAPAGFGKTTLAEQWTRTSASHVAWYPCRNASADVAALCVGIAAVAAEFMPGCEKRLRERLMVTQSPANEVDVLAEILAEDIAGWPPGAWLVIDDYQFLCRTVEAELFVELLVAAAPINVLIAGRRRPSWVSSRDVLYGDVLEVNQTELAMSRDEAELVLDEPEQAGITSGLVAIANGWPAVIALAGVSGVPELPDEDAPEALYDFFAEEVYRGLDPEDRAGLGVLAAATALDQPLADILLGPVRAEHTVAEGVAIGVIVERGERLELHPLARTFIEAKAVEEWPAEHEGAVGSCLETYRARRDWDAAFDLVERNNLVSELEPLLTEALDELLDTARLTTVDSLVRRSSILDLPKPIFAIADAELRLREGKSLAALTLSEKALRNLEVGAPLWLRSVLLAGTSAHVGSREEVALEFFRRAERSAADDREAREARWGQMMCLAELERDDEARQLLAQLSDEVSPDDPRDLVRLATRKLGYELRAGCIQSIHEALETLQLVEFVSDTFVRTSFRAMLSVALVLVADYENAREVAGDLIRDAENHRFDFAMPYALSAAAGAEAGLQNFDKAEALIASALEMASSQGNLQARLNAAGARLRILLNQGRADEVCAEALLPPAPVPSLQGELLALRGLAVACSGRLDEASALAHRAAESTRAVEARVLVAATRAIKAFRDSDPGLGESLETLLAVAESTQAFDLVITAYRACPDLLAVLLRTMRTRDRAWSIVKKGKDDELARLVGVPVPSRSDVRSLLSPREKEIYDLVCQGLTTRQIARMLFISEATVKVHAHHIFDKTGIRSRAGLALNAAREQLRQATSAIFPSDDEPSSSG